MRRLANYIILRFFQSSPSHQVIFLFPLAWRSPGNIPFGFEFRVFLLLDELPTKANMHACLPTYARTSLRTKAGRFYSLATSRVHDNDDYYCLKPGTCRNLLHS